MSDTCGLTGKQAFKSLTRFDRLAIEKVTRTKMAELIKDGMELTTAVYWVVRNRDGEISWQDVSELPYETIESYFDPEPEDEPDPKETPKSMRALTSA